MDFYKFTDKDYEEWINICEPQPTVLMSESRKDPTYYMVNQMGIKPYRWQHKVLNMVKNKYKRIAITTPRQVGKSLLVSCISEWACDMNIYKNCLGKVTKIGVISKTEKQSMKLISDIRAMMVQGDKHVERITAGKVKNYFTAKIDKSKNATNSKSEITFINGSSIVSLPPTDAVRGYTFSIVFVDEAAFIEDDIFYKCIVPTVRATDGIIILTSTPNGQSGFFYEIMDPEDKYPTHEYDRFWLNYKDLDSKKGIEDIEEEIKNLTMRGKAREAEQEYKALFTVQASAFFENEDVNNMFDSKMTMKDGYSLECDCSVDFGMVNSHTVITISTMTTKGIIERLYHKRYIFGTDDDLINDLKELKTRFNIQRFIPDDCSEGYFIIQQMNKQGWNVKPMNFKKDKVSKYFAFRTFLKRTPVGIRSYYDKDLEIEMKNLQEEETQRTTKIYKPNGGTDDMIDSFVMSCYFYLDVNSKGLTVYDLDEFMLEEEKEYESINRWF